MLDRNLIRNEPERLRAALARKKLVAPIDEFLSTDAEWRRVKTSADEKKAEQNRISKSIGQLMGAGKKDEAEAAKAGVASLKTEIQNLESAERELETNLRSLELDFPNPPHESVPDGVDEADNVVAREWGTAREVGFQAKPHWELAEGLKLIDPARAAKISGSGFVVYTGWGARLQRALVSFMIDTQTQKNGYFEVYPPFMVNEASLIGTGQLPKFGDELYKTQDDLYLVPTAEVPVTNLYRDEILEADQLTLKLAAFSGCFRREAGAAGKDTRGIQRVHQFDKVELVKITHPERSYDELESLVKDAESILQALELKYRVSLLCGPEMSFGNAKCYDLELWAPGAERWLEVSSCSNFESFQARRANIRFRPAQGEKPEFCHILNGSGVATPRLFAAILEQHQNEDGSVNVPEALRPYLGTDRLQA